MYMNSFLVWRFVLTNTVSVRKCPVAAPGCDRVNVSGSGMCVSIKISATCCAVTVLNQTVSMLNLRLVCVRVVQQFG